MGTRPAVSTGGSAESADSDDPAGVGAAEWWAGGEVLTQQKKAE